MQRVEDGLLRQALDERHGVVARQAVRRRRVHEQPVRLRRGRHRREPPVAHRELLEQLLVHRHGVRPEPVHHRLRHPRLLPLRLLREPVHGRHLHVRRRDRRRAGREGHAVHLSP